MAGMMGNPTVGTDPRLFGTRRPIGGPPPPNPVTQAYNLYNSNVGRDAEDRDEIMKNYRRLATEAPAMIDIQAATANGKYTPQMGKYTASPDVTSALGNLKEYSRTGGYSDQNIQDMRARSISPIRSIYANALREITRNRSLQGGFSPNYNATRAKMAREMSAQIGDRSQDVEGQLAGMQAQGRQSMAPSYANAANAQNQLENDINQRNVEATNEANRFNLQFPLQLNASNLENYRARMAPIEGMRSLYGTTPASSALFGNQALNTAQLQNTMDDQVQGRSVDLIGGLLRGRG